MGISVSYNNQPNPTTIRTAINIFQFFCTICYTTFCSCLFLFGLLIMYMGMSYHGSQRNETCLVGFMISAVTISLCMRSCRTLKQYSVTSNNRRRQSQRSNEQNENQDLTTNCPTDLPNYRELYPSQLNINLSSNTQPPSYDDFIKNSANCNRIQNTTLSESRLIINPPQTSLSIPNSIDFV